MKEPMDIYCKPGTKLMVTEASLRNGYKIWQETAKRHLEIGKTYELDKTKIEDWSTRIFLKEFPGISFNSVNFVEVKGPDNE